MFQLNLVTPEKRLVVGMDVEEVIVPGYRGQLDILPGHAPLITTLNAGVVAYRLKGQNEKQKVAVSWGYLEVSPTGVTILAETAETPEQVDVERAKSALDRSVEQLRVIKNPEEFEKYRRKSERARVRLTLKDQ